MKTKSERLAHAMEVRGIPSAAELARLTGMELTTVRSNVNGHRGFAEGAAVNYGRALKVDPAWLLMGKGKSPEGIEEDLTDSATRDMEKSLDAPFAVQGSARAFAEYLPLGDQADNEPSNVRKAERAPDVAHWTLPRDTPVMGTSQCGDDGAFELNAGTPVKYVPTPPGIAGVEGVYAIFTEGDSMRFAEARSYAPGQLVYVHSRLSPLVGREVVIQLKPQNEGDTPRAFLKLLLSKGIGGYQVKQWNPAKEIFFPIDTVLTIHRVLTLEELLNA